ncbi:hypothetical protein EV360DRAFT_80050 [Lentinula raphanica]|nr:hypothetical protein EV360DRAFT_80050 [Lentinula raphanica]
MAFRLDSDLPAFLPLLWYSHRSSLYLLHRLLLIAVCLLRYPVVADPHGKYIEEDIILERYTGSLTFPIDPPYKVSLRIGNLGFCHSGPCPGREVAKHKKFLGKAHFLNGGVKTKALESVEKLAAEFISELGSQPESSDVHDDSVIVKRADDGKEKADSSLIDDLPLGSSQHKRWKSLLGISSMPEPLTVMAIMMYEWYVFLSCTPTTLDTGHREFPSSWRLKPLPKVSLQKKEILNVTLDLGSTPDFDRHWPDSLDQPVLGSITPSTSQQLEHIDGYYHNPLHDLESVWWVILCFNDDIKELAPGPETRQDIMDQLFNGRLEYWNRLSFFNETDGLKKARRYMSPNSGCNLSERNYPPTIDDTSFLIHSSLLKRVLQNLVYVASLSKITLVPVKANLQRKGDTQEEVYSRKRSRHSSSGDAGGLDSHGSNQGKRNVRLEDAIAA